ncbi:unnamed protein product, partial [Symbiodinium microadriaticum]
VERASLQGLQLLAARLNQSTPWNGPTNLPLKLHIQVEDDHGDPGKAAEIYARMLRNREVDFLFGLHSSELFKVAVDAGNSANVLTLISGGPHLLGPAIRPPLYSPWTFSPDVQVQDQMAGVLELVQHQVPPVSSVAMVWDGGSAFDKEMCTGASSHAQRLGMEVLDNMSVAEQAIMPQMRQLKAAGPDLLIACGNLRSAEQILASTLGGGLGLRRARQAGLRLSETRQSRHAREAVRSIGAHLANYVLSPLIWEPVPSQSCPVFGSARDFADAYRSKFGEEPLPASAAAAAGGIALLAAVKTASSLEQAAVREALLAREQQTCYGRLAFSMDGLRQNPTTLVQQVQPLDEDQPKMDRWTSSQIVTVGHEQPLTGWPLPTWAQKEIDVYPCNPGQAVVLDIGGNATTCAECPAGRFRTPRSVECEDCQPGTYGMQPGMSQCDVCPSGAACPGYYQLPAASLEGAFVPCYPSQLCIGENQCVEAHHGILCQSCEFGFSKPLWGLKRDKCSKCPSQRVTIGSIALTISVYVLYIWLIVKGTKSASQSMRALPSVILKIGVNYMQFAGTAFEATNFKGMVSAVCGEGSASWIFPVVALPERLQYPLTTLMSIDQTSSARLEWGIGRLGVIQEAAHEEEGGEPSCRISVPLSPSSGASPTRRDARTPTSPTSPASLRAPQMVSLPPLRPHLLRDIKLLQHVMGISISAEAVELFSRVSDMAAAALGKQCAEMRSGKIGESDLELFESPGAALGIRTLRHTLPGQLLGFYPGTVMDACEPNLPKSDKLFANEYNGVYLDGKGWLPAHWRDHHLLQGQSRAIWHANRLAVGNLLNHPPADILPNCIPMAFRWPTWSELGEENPALWARLLPHVFMRQGQVVQTASGRRDDQGAVKFPAWPYMGMAFITVLEARSGEELFWNYRRPADAPGMD